MYAGAGLSLIAFVLFFSGSLSTHTPVPDTNQEATTTDVVSSDQDRHVYADGVLTKGGPLLKPGVWYVGLEVDGKPRAVELAFDENSICSGKTASGTCLPDIFIENRPVHIEGVVDGDAMRVLELTFTQPIK